MADPTPAEDRLESFERGFRRAGLPLLIEGYSPARDIFNRAVPLLGFVFIAEMLGAVDLQWSLLGNLAAVFGGLAILLVGIAVSNRLRGRPFRSIPRTVGWAELAGFVLLPALLPLIFGGQWRSALVTAAGNLLLLALILGVVGFGLMSIVRWALARMVGQFARSLDLLSKAVPLLLLFAILIFPTTEIWEVFAESPTLNYAILLALFVGLGVLFLAARLPREVRALEREAVESGPGLNRRQRLNVGLVLFVSQGLQVLLVSVAIGAFFVIFGALTVDAEILRGWIGTSGDEVFSFTLDGNKIAVTAELLRVSGGIAAFTGLYFAISVLTDELYRREFLEELTAEMRRTFRERAEYLALRGA